MLPFYQDQDTPVHQLHPAAKLASVLAVVLAALILAHPNYLLALLAGGSFTQAQMLRFQRNGIPALPTASRMIRALDKVVSYVRWRDANAR